MATQHVDEYTEDVARPESLWKRAFVMVGFMIALGMGQTIVHLIAILQFVTIVFNKRPSSGLSEFGASLALWLREVAAYQCMATEEKPFPWKAWPDVPLFDADDETV